MVMRKPGKVMIFGLLCLGILLIVLPIYITVVTAMKTAGESLRSFFTLPSSLMMDNFERVINSSGYWRSFGNTILITVIVLLGNVLIMPPLSYTVTRSMGSSKIIKALYFYLLIGIFIPFQVKMIPLVKMMSAFGMSTPVGLAILCIGSNTCESTFLYVGFMQSLPAEIEEAAYIDGASTARTFYEIVMPLITPILATALIKEALWIWNDFMLPMLILTKNDYFTLSLYAYNFKSIDQTDFGALFACYILQMLPMLIFYLFAQKHIIGGLTAGSVKG